MSRYALTRDMNEATAADLADLMQEHMSTCPTQSDACDECDAISTAIENLYETEER